MPTAWTYPTVASQFYEFTTHVPWTNNTTKFVDTELDLTLPEYEISYLRTEKDLMHIPNTAVNDLKMKSWYLKLTGFKFRHLPESITGIEAKVNVKRVGRIMDDTIQLYSLTPLGDNKANNDLTNDKIYGSETDLWGLDPITPDFFDDNFGIIVRYQSHPTIPHKETPTMTHVQVRVW